MPTTHYNSQEEMDEAFDNLMEREQEKVRLREEIREAEGAVNELLFELEDARQNLKCLEERMQDLEEGV